jgi:transcriptional regulator with XRE-family HTH domain/tetratricopeptide (TPR) repeat protein
MSDAPAFGELLRRHRHESELTIEELSAASGVSVRAIGDMERGRSRGPQRRTVSALAEALRLTADEQEALSDAAQTGRPRAAAPASGVCEPPRGIYDFTGREEEVAWLRELAMQVTSDGPATTATISGGPGLGKTALVVHAAELLAEYFPDGHFFVDLRGMDAAPLDAGQVLSRLLRAFGADERRIPQDEEERAGYFRALLRDRRSLVVLDNAMDEAQVRPLLPGGGDSLVLVTSRRSLAGLEGVHHLSLEEMSRDEAVALLQTIVGKDRAAAELDEVARLCGDLPLAMRIAGNRLLSRPGWTAGHLAGRLADEERRLEMLSAGDLHVAAAFTLSYQQLSSRARETFRRLALVPGPDFGIELGMVLAQSGPGDTEDALEELVELGLLQSPYVARYRLHDLVRLFARSRLVEEEPEEARQAAVHRINGWLLDVAIVAGRWFEPGYGAPPADWNGLVRLDTHEEAETWLKAESANWLAALRSAAEDGHHATVLEVADAMHWFSDRWLHWGYWHEVFGLSHEAAHAMGDRRAEAVHLNYFAWALASCEGRYAESADRALEALALARAAGDLGQQGWALDYAARATLQLHDVERAAGYAREAAALFDAAGDADGYPQAVAVLCDCLRRLDRPREALQHNLTLLNTLRDPEFAISPNVRELSLGSTLARIARDKAALGRWPEAVDHFREAIPHLGHRGALFGVNPALCDLGRALREIGEMAAAREAFEEAIIGYLATGEADTAAEIRRELSECDA